MCSGPSVTTRDFILGSPSRAKETDRMPFGLEEGIIGSARDFDELLGQVCLVVEISSKAALLGQCLTT